MSNRKICISTVLVSLIVILTTCQSPSLSPPPASLPTQNSTTPPGHLAYIGADGNVYVTTADLQTTIAITEDATAPREGAGLSYQRLAWSPDGQLAYASVTRQRDEATSQLFVQESLGGPATVVGQSDDHFVIYIYWSPAPCGGQPDCQQLAYLIEEEEDIGLHLVTMRETEIENTIIGFGWPYYYGWSPDGQSMLWHTGGAVLDNPAARLISYQLDGDTPQALSQKPAAFLAPAWSPRGEGWLGAVLDDGASELQWVTDEATKTIAPVSAGGASFVWSPDGRQVAYAVRHSSNDRFYGPIHLYDVVSGQSHQLTANGFQILAFFWDPAGERLGYISLLAMPDAEWMQWRVFDVVNGEDRGFKSFNPSLQMRFVMASFNQYAQSHRFWSPDGRYLVYASRDEILRREQVGLVDTWAEDGTQTIFVAEGTMGFWSWQ